MKKILTFLTTALLAFGVGWADEVVMTMSNYYSTTSNTDAGTISEGDITITFAKAQGTNEPQYYYSGTAIRFYAKNTMTISVGSGTITSVKVEFNTTNYAGLASSWSVSDGTWSSSNSSTIGTWSGQASSITFTNGSSQTRFKAITITTSGGSTTVAPPTFDPADGATFPTSQQVTISAADGATIYYNYDNGSNWNTYSAPLTLTQTTTVYAYAELGGVQSTVASATYTNNGVATIAEALALDLNTNFVFTGNVAVTACTTNYVWLRDNTGSGLIYLRNISITPANFPTGTVIEPNWIGERVDYHGTKEFRVTSPNTITASANTQNVEPFERTTISNDNMNEYVIINGLNITGSSTVNSKTQYTTQEGITLYDYFDKNFTITTGKTYNVTGVVGYDNQITPNVRLYITNVEEVTSSNPLVLVSPDELTINDSGTNNTFTVEGSNLGTDNVGLTQTDSNFTPTLSATTGTPYAGGTYWGFSPAGGSVNGTVAMNYTGRELSASETVTLGNNTGASATVTVNYLADLYIVGNFGSGWDFSTGTPMTYNNGTYTANVTVNAGNLILFARKYDTNELWNTRYVFGPNSSGDWWVNGDVATGTIDLYDDDPVYFVNAGTYTIEINASTGALTITKESTPEGTLYEKVTSNDDIVNGEYLIVYETDGKAFDGSLDNMDPTGNVFDVTINNNKIITEKAAYFTIDATAGTIQSASGYYIGRTANSNGFNQSETEAYTHTIAIDNSGNAIITSSSGPKLQMWSQMNNGVMQYRFRYYTSTQKSIQLYRKHSDSTEPRITVNPASLNLEIPAGGTSQEGTVAVTEINTTGTTSVSINGDTNIFSATLTNGTLTVTYSGNAIADHPDGATIILTNGTASATVTVTGYKEPITVSISPASGNFTGTSMTGTITSNVASATLEYSVDGGTTWLPANNGNFTIDGVAVGQSVTVQARATYNGETSETVSATYTRVDAGSTLYTKVTSAEQIQAGLHYILVHEQGPDALNGFISTNGGTGVRVAWQGSDNNIANTDAIEFTMSGDANQAKFYYGNGVYLGRGTNNNYLYDNDETEWVLIKDNDNGGYYLAAGTESNAYKLRYNTTMTGADKFRCYANNTGEGVYLYVQGEAGLVTPQISPASGSYPEDQEVTITCTTQGAIIYYTLNGGEPQVYTDPFNVDLDEDHTSATIVAWAEKDGETSNQVTVTYTYKSDKVYSIAEFLELGQGEEATFMNPVVVLFDYSQNSSGGQEYIWIKDRTGYTQLFIVPQFDAASVEDPQYEGNYGQFVPKYENGDVIKAGFKVKKNYYSNGQYYQGLCNNTHNTFQIATEKALADPEQVMLSDLINPNNDYEYAKQHNNRYLYINKLKVSNISGYNFSISSDEDGDGIAEIVGGNAVVGYNKYDSPAWKNKNGVEIGVDLPTDGQYYNVKFIFQKWQGGYEIMPIEFTPWEDNSLRLEDLVKIGEEGHTYTISNQLKAAAVTWDDNQHKFAIFAKDDEMYANKRYPGSGMDSYLIRYENNYVIEVDGEPQDSTFINDVPQEDYDQSNWIEILIPSTISSKGDNNYMSALDGFKDQFEGKILEAGKVSGTYIDALNPTIQVTTLPTTADVITSPYAPNYFCTGNFLMENLDGDGAQSYRDGEPSGSYFMMDAKPQEYCKVVWAYFEDNSNYFVAPEREGDLVNGLRLHGSFLADMSLCEDQSVTAERSAQDVFDASGTNTSTATLYGFRAIVRKNRYSTVWNGSNGAPHRIQPYSDGMETPQPAYIVYPLEGQNSSENVTDVEEVLTVKTVKSVRFYNLMGVESDKPFEGINIVVTRYSDGSTSTVKVLK